MEHEPTVINGKLIILLNDGVRMRIPFNVDGNPSEIDNKIKYMAESFKSNYPDGKITGTTEDGNIEKNMSDVEAFMITREDTDEIIYIDFLSEEGEII